MRGDVEILAGAGALVQLPPCGSFAGWWPPFLLHKAHVGCGEIAFRSFLNCPKLCFVSGQILSHRAPNALRVPRADNRAAEQLALRAIGKNVNDIQGELFQIVVNHHQVAVLPLQFLFVGLDLHLALHRLLLIHLVPLPECRSELTTSPCAALAPPPRVESSLSSLAKIHWSPIDS